MQIGDLTLSYGQNYTFVPSNGTPAENAEALRATYNTSRVKRPQGKALSRDNRFAIILAPGIYSFDTNSFIMDTNYIDLIGVAGAENTVITSCWADDYLDMSVNLPQGLTRIGAEPIGTWGRQWSPNKTHANGLIWGADTVNLYDANNDLLAIGITATDVIVKGIDCLCLKHSGVGAGLLFEDVILGAFSATSMGGSYIGTAATYINSKFKTACAYGGAIGTFINITGAKEKCGNSLLGINYRNSGLFFTDCSGLFINCVCKSSNNLSEYGNVISAGSGHRNMGFRFNCTGKFLNCISEDGGFGANGETRTGVLTYANNVITNTHSYSDVLTETKDITGIFIGCISGRNAFGGVSVGTNSGTFISCVAGANSFGSLNGGSTAKKMACLHGGVILNQTV